MKNQADDIRIIYQELNKINNINLNMNQINKNKLSNNDRLESFKSPKIPEFRNSFNDNSNIMSIMENELSKKASLDQLNFA